MRKLSQNESATDLDESLDGELQPITVDGTSALSQPGEDIVRVMFAELHACPPQQWQRYQL